MRITINWPCREEIEKSNLPVHSVHDCGWVSSAPNEIARLSLWSKAYCPSRWSHLEKGCKRPPPVPNKAHLPPKVQGKAYCFPFPLICLFSLFLSESEKILACMELLLFVGWQPKCPEDSASWDSLHNIRRLNKWPSSSESLREAHWAQHLIMKVEKIEAELVSWDSAHESHGCLPGTLNMQANCGAQQAGKHWLWSWKPCLGFWAVLTQRGTWFASASPYQWLPHLTTPHLRWVL